MYATVVIDISSKQLNRLFEYKIPEAFEKTLKKGMRVIVDFNESKRLAYVVDIISVSKLATKDILFVLDEKPTLSSLQLKLVEHLQSKSFSTYAESFQAVVPNALHGNYEYSFEVIEYDKLKEQLKTLVKNNKIDVKKVSENDFSLFNQALKKGYLKRTVKITDKVKVNYEKLIMIKNKNSRLTKKQKLVVDDLNEHKSMAQLIKLGHSKGVIERLIKNNVLTFKLIPKYKDYTQNFLLNENLVNLTKEQQQSVSSVSLNKAGRYLLFGPPASGKTEVYLKLIEEVLKEKKQALILVPEIALIPQMVSRIESRFSHTIAVYHSGLSARVRYDNYLKVKDKKTNIIIGTRSSVFLPFSNLGIIIVDEAHDLSYIQKTRPYYHTLELSFLISEAQKCPVVFGSATPTVSMFHDAKLGKIRLLELSKRISDLKVKVKVVDMKEELIKGNFSMFSNLLKTALKNTLEKNEQAIILVNKRGYAPFVLCRTCGHVYKCPNCHVSLVYHKHDNLLKCHHCNHTELMPTLCHVCKNNTIKPVGFGAEQVEEELLKEFKGIKVLRMDSDTTSKSGSHDLILSKFLNQKADVLLGTQMVSKGHHFSNVSLVVVLLADQMLYLNSYLANELTYNLLTQHIGRIRNKEGLAILQAYNTNHFVLKSVLNNSYDSYYNNELQTRKLLKLEPFYNVIKITFKGKEQTKTYEDIKSLALNFAAKNTQIIMVGPSEEYIFYTKGRYNYSVTFKIPKSFKIDTIMSYFDKKYTKDYYIDIDYYPSEI